METPHAGPHIPPVTPCTTPHEANRDEERVLARWVAQLDAAQRRTNAAYVQGRLRVLDRILELVADATREGRLYYDSTGRACCADAPGHAHQDSLRTPSLSANALHATKGLPSC